MMLPTQIQTELNQKYWSICLSTTLPQELVYLLLDILRQQLVTLAYILLLHTHSPIFLCIWQNLVSLSLFPAPSALPGLL